jgi:threonylcarbamoyladenosine tRNA methylthiotransferase MtaB
MRRPYTTEHFANAVARARAKIPEVAITTDVIVGFPGEADVEFHESLEFVARMNFARVHVFPYSAREGTVAAKLPLHVSDLVRDARAKAMQRVADASQYKFAQQHLGRTFNVLYEEQSNDAGIFSGYTDNYIRVTTRSSKNLGN